MPYFDYNATTPLCSEARDAWLQAQELYWHNASSMTRGASQVAVQLNNARARFASLLNCAPQDIVFCSGATEANNAVLRHLAQAHPDQQLLVSAIEHPSVREAAKAFFKGRLTEIPVDAEGVVDVDFVEKAIAKGGVALCSVMAANNETGVVQPWSKLANLCKAHGVPYHCDGVQWVGKDSAQGLGVCDFMTISGHKFGAPKGVGLLKLTSNYAGIKLAYGGIQEHAHRAGTEDLASVAAMLAALENAEAHVRKHQQPEEGRDLFEAKLLKTMPDLTVVGRCANRMWNTSLLLMPAYENTQWVSALDQCGFEVATGSACSTGSAGASHVLAAQGVSAFAQKRAVRVSAGWESSVAHWQALADAFITVWEGFQASSASSQVISLD